ncbi:hypothetical protein ACOSQ4_015145 [Xanthoceras sorbifolium]
MDNAVLTRVRFSYIAVCCLSILHWLDKINVDKAVNYIVSCKNLDGGFGCTPGASLMQGKDLKNGGISDRPDDAVDVFHTYFGVADWTISSWADLYCHCSFNLKDWTSSRTVLAALESECTFVLWFTGSVPHS